MNTSIIGTIKSWHWRRTASNSSRALVGISGLKHLRL